MAYPVRANINVGDSTIKLIIKIIIVLIIIGLILLFVLSYLATTFIGSIFPDLRGFIDSLFQTGGVLNPDWSAWGSGISTALTDWWENGFVPSFNDFNNWLNDLFRPLMFWEG